VLRSALRVMSLVSVLALVVGIVVLTQEPGSAEEATGTTAAAAAVDPARSAAAARSAADSLAHQRVIAAEARRRAVAAADAAAAAREKAERKARQKAAAAAALKARTEARARATRNALRDPQSIARIMVLERGWSASQFSCLRSLWERESNWNPRADNPASSAYGIPQALPGPKMASAGPDWRTNPVTQIKWGLGYIADRYGTPCGAWAHSESHNWY
jgi:hypothetical protein